MNSDLLERAEELGLEIYDSSLAKQYRSAYMKAFDNAETAAMISRYFTLRSELEKSKFANETLDADTQNEFQALGVTLQFNKNASDFLIAEYNYSGLVNDIIQKIINSSGISYSFSMPDQ